MHAAFFWLKDELAPALFIVLEITSRGQGSELFGSTMIPQSCGS